MKTRDNKWKNFCYLLHSIKKKQSKLYLFYVLNIMIILIYSITCILTPRYLIAELTGTRSIKNIVLIASIYLLFITISGYLGPWVKYHYELGISHMRYYFMEQTKDKIMRVEYKSLEDPKYLNQFWRVISATSDIEFGVQGTLIALFTLSASAVTSIFYIGILSQFNLWIVLLLAVNILLVYIIRKKSNSYEVKTSKEEVPYRRRQHYLAKIMGDFAYGKDIRIYGLSNYILNKLIENHRPKRKIEADIQKHNYLADFLESILSCIRDTIIYFYLIQSVLDGMISIADFTMYFMTVSSFTIALEKVFEGVAFVNSDIFRIGEMRDFLELPNEEIADGSFQSIPESNQYELVFEHVSFRYPNTDQNVYTDFNFTIKAGEKLAIVGVNGAGKTTLVKLITRLYQPTEGKILLNGIDINEFRLSEYRNILSTIFQDINLFAMSLKENICCTDENFDSEKFEYAIKNADLTKFYEQHGNNPELQLTRYLSDEGVDLSGGEKQKIGIARALYHGGNIMIFDEPTAALDANAEYRLYYELSTIAQNKTLIFISHRLASTRFCDEIVLIDGGKVLEKGTHEELMEMRGLYYAMFLTQKKYYEEEEG